MEDILVPITICVVLPVMIVWLVTRARQNETNRKTEIMLKAIEAGAAVDPNLFSKDQGHISLKERLLKRLTGACVTSLLGVACIILNLVQWAKWGETLSRSTLSMTLAMGCILLAIGVALFIVYFVGKKMLSKEIEAEENSLKGRESK